MSNTQREISLVRRSALIAGLGLLVMALTVPFAELGIIPDMVNYSDAQETFENIRNELPRFNLAFSFYLITFFMDVVVAWALYVFLRPVHAHFSLLTAWMRIVYTVIALAATLNLVNVMLLTGSPGYLSEFGDLLPAMVLTEIRKFGWQWAFSFFFFGTYLIMLGYLVIKAEYVPKIMGVLLIIAGAGYLIDTLGRFYFSEVNLEYLMITFMGELVFMLWLLIKGWRIEAPGSRG
jgi:hypothetical protein